MDTLIVGVVGALVGIVGTLITSWFTTRYTKSTDAKTLLLLKIDESVNDSVKFFFSISFYATDTNFDSTKSLEQYAEKVTITRWIGVAKVLGNEDLAKALQRLSDEIWAYYDMLVNTRTLLDEKKIVDKNAVVGEKKGSGISPISKEIHALIAQELIRVYPRRLERAWKWLREKVS